MSKIILEYLSVNCRWSDINIFEFFDAISYPGFRKLAFKFVGAGIDEMIRSFYTAKQVKLLQKFVPSISVKDVKAGPAGVRAQALDLEGNLVDDFYFDMSKGKGTIADRVLHCRNAPSPGATSSLAIAKMMVEKIEKEFNLK